MPVIQGVGALTAHPLNKGLESWLLNLQPRAGGRWPDLSGCGTDNLQIGAASSRPIWGPERLGHATVDFDGTDDLLDWPDPFPVRIGDSASVTMWLKLRNATPSDANKTGLMYFNSVGLADTHYPYTDGSFYCGIFRNDRLTLTPSSLVDRTKWHMLAVTQTPGTGGYNVYQNGINIHSGTGEATVSHPAIPFLGAAQLIYKYDGWMDDVRLYSRALSSTEVRQLVNIGRQRYPGVLNYQRQVWAVTAAPGGRLSKNTRAYPLGVALGIRVGMAG